MTCLGTTSPDPVGQQLGTGYLKFCNSCLGVDGLAKFQDKRLHILFIGTAKPGTGQFRRFMEQAKTEFDAIFVWEVWNEMLVEILKRYEFVAATDWQCGELVHGFMWRNKI